MLLTVPMRLRQAVIKLLLFIFHVLSSTNKESIKMGEKGSTHYTSSEVAQINKFHNAMDGKADYYTVSDGCSVITRKDGGAVIVKGSGSGGGIGRKRRRLRKTGYIHRRCFRQYIYNYIKHHFRYNRFIGYSSQSADAEPEGPSASVTPGSTKLQYR